MQNDKSKLEVINYIEKASNVILGLLFILFPLLFTNLTTDFFLLPKQALIIFTVLVLMLLYGIKIVLMEKVSIRRTPFDLPILLFIFALLLSSIFSVAIFDSFINFIPLLFAGLVFFTIVFNAKNEKSVMVLVSSLLTGGVLLSLVSVFSYLKVYVFPYDFTKNQLFSPAGSTLDQILYLLFLLPLGFYFISPFIFGRKNQALAEQRKKDIPKLLGFGIASIIILSGLIVSVYSLLKLGNITLLPIDTGFQTAFAAISQDSGRIFQGLLFGSGFGQFLTDFTRFKQATFNANQAIWTLTFVRSSSFALELLATTGLLGFLSFLYLIYKVVRERPLFLPLLVAFGASFILPLSYYTVVLIFFLLGIYASIRGLKDNQKYFDVELQLVALKKGFFALAIEESAKSSGSTKTLSYTFFAAIAIIALIFGFLTFDFLKANVNFQKSLVAASQNNGQVTYTYQSNALASFTGKYIDSYYRVFSQTNLALANTLASSIPQGASPSAQTTQTIYTLVQQSINAGRQATTLSPKNTFDWQNLASIYRNLIGFGQNADSFAILAQQQAVSLDSANPQEYIALGGIYYQLQSWDNAQNQFQQAINLKQDYPNAYYNLGHVLEQKGDLRGALTQYQTVKSLVANDPTNLAKINSEISVLEQRLGQAQQAAKAPVAPAETQTPLVVPSPTTLPKQNPPVKIPGPSGTITPTPTGEPSSTPTPTVSL